MFKKLISFIKNSSLVFKLSTSILLTILIGSFLLSIFISNYSKPLLKEQVISAAYKALGEVNHSLAQGADITEQSIVNTARILELKDSINDDDLNLLAQAGLESITKQYGHFYEFFIYILPKHRELSNGTFYYSYIKNGEIHTLKWKETGFAKNREWLTSALNTGKIHWTEPYMAENQIGEKILSSSVSIPFKFKGSSDWDGVIGTSGNLDAMRQWLNSYKFEANGKYLLTSAKGLYLVHPDKNIELKKTISELADEINSKQLKYVANQVKNGKSGFVTMPKSSVYNSEVVFVYSPIPKTNWSSYLVYSSDNFYKPIKHFQLILLSVTVFGVLLLILFVNWICKFTTSPIIKLSNVAEKYGKGEFETELPPVTSNDEVGVLTQAFYTMRNNLLNLLTIQKENAKEEQKRASELEIAKKIQASVLPVDFPKTTHFDIFASMNPAKEVGGDFYDFFFVDENRFVFLIADVSGKGIPAALFMMNAKSLLKSNLLSGYPLNIAINKTNNELCATNDAKMFITAFIAILNTQTGELEFVNAGHNPPAIKLNDKFEYLKSDNNLVLSALENFEYKSSKIFLKPENNILIYTDGVTEAQNIKEKFYGEERLINLLNNKMQEPKEIIETITADINGFSDGASQFDDITMLDIKFLG
ncbi:MAG: SpoIIE family protein phosphatase [Candidatus Gastranaerophilales bacterium]|nr:SpoIIE family protein phosphatase [Candidatus Gastranaerophilales bacterium]